MREVNAGDAHSISIKKRYYYAYYNKILFKMNHASVQNDIRIYKLIAELGIRTRIDGKIKIILRTNIKSIEYLE